VVEKGNDGVNMAGVKGTGDVLAGAEPGLAGAPDVELAAVVGGEAECVEGLRCAGVGLAEPGSDTLALLVRGEGLPEGLEVGMVVGVDPVGAGLVAALVGAAGVG
jgi:hypothetical protein